MLHIEDLLDRGAIAPRVAASNKRQALSVIAEIAARSFGLKAPEVFDALMEREQAGSTGVGYGCPPCPTSATSSPSSSAWWRG